MGTDPLPTASLMSPTAKVSLIPAAQLLIVLNVAEDAGEFSPDEKSRFYRIARRSATEAGAILHIYARRGQGPQDQIGAARELLVRVVSMLVQITKSLSRR